MKTKKDFRTLNYSEFAFFKGCDTGEAKLIFSDILFPNDWHKLILIDGKKVYNPKYVNKSGNPKISAKDYIELHQLKIHFLINSNSHLDNTCQFEYLCDYYNNGIPLQKLREHSQNKTFLKALKFTGKNSIINEIINPEQLLKIQKTWLLSNTYMKNTWSKNCIEFIENTEWALAFLEVNMIYESEFLEQKRKLNPEKELA